jgi:hypothetical protein
MRDMRPTCGNGICAVDPNAIEALGSTFAQRCRVLFRNGANCVLLAKT